MSKKKQPVVLLRDMIPALEWELFEFDQENEVEFLTNAAPEDRVQHMGLRTLAEAQTILIHPKIVDELSRQQRAPMTEMPFPIICFQLTEPAMPKRILSYGKEANNIKDRINNAIVLGLIITRLSSAKTKPTSEPTDICYTVSYRQKDGIYFIETIWRAESGRPIIPPQLQLSMTREEAQEIANSFTLIRNLIYYITEAVDLREHQAPAPKSAAPKPRRQRATPRTYYTCAIRPRVVTPEPKEPAPPAEPTDRHVSHEFDVRGHWRHYRSGAVVWIKSHRRGVGRGPYVPKIYTLGDTGERNEQDALDS